VAEVRTIVELIKHKRDGGALSASEIERIIASHGDGRMADYQMTALCMAVFFSGMTPAETAALTGAMLRSGTQIDLGDVDRPKVDKHSTGGVGDKVSLCLAPLVAACGAAVPMISGRGLGHTGGTLDKLEAIAGFTVDQDIAAFRRIVRDVGVAMIGQTAELAPADKKLYALRDVTATVESIPLIVASILSKKLAEGIDALVLDVKVGKGAFMKTQQDALELAKALVSVGSEAGKRVSAMLTDMSAPLGRAVGNANETAEAIDVLRGEGPDDLVELTVALGAEMLRVAELVPDGDSGRAKMLAAIADGSGARVMERMIEAQGGDASVVENPDKLVRAEHEVAITSDQAGVVTAIDALEIGLTAVAMGAGRTRADQDVDHAVGIELECARGDRVEAGQPLARLQVHDPNAADGWAVRVRGAFEVREEAEATPPPLILETLLAI
jgi:pyrimidine-nucleoside phosphorylase